MTIANETMTHPNAAQPPVMMRDPVLVATLLGLGLLLLLAAWFYWFGIVVMQYRFV